MEFLRVWFAGLMNMFGDFERENLRLESAKQSSTKLKAIKSLNLPPPDEEGVYQKNVMDRTRKATNIYPQISGKDITHNRLEALSSRLSESQA
ncbi:MAG: hypothetical protein IT343_24670 [Candidatus Melainabacteria bacterium]|jgi:hypothetical protein|nr:hypothetical protein [Candidatus Melainabacteria bacterium]